MAAAKQVIDVSESVLSALRIVLAIVVIIFLTTIVKAFIRSRDAKKVAFDKDAVKLLAASRPVPSKECGCKKKREEQKAKEDDEEILVDLEDNPKKLWKKPMVKVKKPASDNKDAKSKVNPLPNTDTKRKRK